MTQAAADRGRFDERFRGELRRLFAWRRDIRRFRPDPLPAGALDRLIEVACSAPSVGLSQPWRFVVVDDPDRRAQIAADFRACNRASLAAYDGETAAAYARLKLAGLQEAPSHVAVFADRDTAQGRSLGRVTMPQTAEYSAVAAIVTLWLAARAEGIGLGWVSILNPDTVAAVLSVPQTWRFVGYLCLGYPEAVSDTPELERERWESRRSAGDFVLRR